MLSFFVCVCTSSGWWCWPLLLFRAAIRHYCWLSSRRFIADVCGQRSRLLADSDPQQLDNSDDWNEWTSNWRSCHIVHCTVWRRRLQLPSSGTLCRTTSNHHLLFQLFIIFSRHFCFSSHFLASSSNCATVDFVIASAILATLIITDWLIDWLTRYQDFNFDTILTKYRDIDTISIFCKCVRYTSARTVTRHEQGSMLYLENKSVCFSDL